MVKAADLLVDCISHVKHKDLDFPFIPFLDSGNGIGKKRPLVPLSLGQLLAFSLSSLHKG